ncbi:hypothetical protein FNV43_RR14013 [Rhamnella rubrinervis]|uniref:DNA ligase (ATP) n=1 Tax=Rhamnella rubrinervis TaxID=2594499 RepID=A0A8K0MG08_9ROSA|nr:hypothetical protein FNV43_RR14013 [Rhamnella rubrinervis]
MLSVMPVTIPSLTSSPTSTPITTPASPLIVPLPLCEPVLIDGCEVVLVDANHCPGAVQFLFKIPVSNGKFEKYVHTGDFRFCDSMKSNPLLLQFVGSDAVFLDTTYCNPKFVFPSQEESIDYIVSVIEKVGGEYNGSIRNVLFLVATYVIGKEKILLEIARRCNRKVHVDARKMSILNILGSEESGVFTEDECGSDVHVVGWNVLGETWPYFRPNFVKMKEIMIERGYTRTVGFVPTGWTYEVKRNKFSVRTKDALEIHLVPYSEHSNYNELREYVRFLKPKRVVPTVGLDVEKLESKHVNKMKKHFAGLVDEMANKQEFLKGFHRGCVEMSEVVDKDFSDSTSEGLHQGKEANLSNMKGVENNDVCFVSKQLSPLQETDSQNMTDEKILQELHDCLPTWVTRDQMLDLIGSSGRDIVEAVSTFYERETEFHEQVSGCKASTSTSQISSLDECATLLKPNNIESVPYVKIGIPLSAESGSKQSTVTRFFNKVLSDVSQGAEDEHMNEKSPKGESLPCVATKLYGDEIDQFIQVINGSESLKAYAATIMERTNGDINRALDIYYNNPESRLGENEGEMAFGRKLSQSQCEINKCSFGQKKFVSEKKTADFSMQILSSENADANSVALPPEKYSPVEHACWMDGQPAPYLHLARTFGLLEDEKGKIKATSMLCNMFRSLLALSPEDVLPAVYLCTNKIASDHENVELNIGGSLVTSAVEEVCGASRSKIREMYNDLGDLGDVAQACRQTQKLLAPPSPLLIKDVFSALRNISVQTGSGSTVRKKNLIVRNLRIGVMMKTVLPALAQAIVMHSSPNFHQERTVDDLKEKLQCLSAAVVEAYNVVPSLDLVVPSLMNKGIGFSTSTLSMVPGIPIKPMLAKYDGQRAQIHKLADGCVRVFSRNGDESTSRFPDVINIIKESCKPNVETFIIDAEVVAIDRKNGSKLMSFQELSSRGRGGKDTSITLDSIKVDICVFVFDIMFANGQQLLDFPLRQRRKYLEDLFHGEKLGHLEYAKEVTVEAEDACLTSEATLAKISSFLENAFLSSCEGIMVKCLDVDAGYSPSKRTDTWLKVKRDYVEGLNDSLDLVPIGAWHGNGRKAGWYSPFLMACYNPDTEEFQSVCRVMSGFSDSFYAEMKNFFSGDKILSKKPPYYRTAEAPDMWFSSELVWEIRGADFTVSPVHEAAIGLVHPSRGISIRFPRYIRTVSDRKPEECSTAADIAEMFHSQTRKMDVMAG